MRLDHLSYAAGPEGLDATVERISAALGVERIKGGVHPRFGTRNAILPMADDTVVLPGHGPETTIGRENRACALIGTISNASTPGQTTGPPPEKA